MLLADCGHFCGATEQMKAAQRAPATTLVLFITKRKCTEYDTDNTRHHDPFLSDRIIKD